MHRKGFLLFAYILFVFPSFGQISSQGKTAGAFRDYVLSESGAWCWFADPRAIQYKNEKGTINSTYIGYIDPHGYIKATQINHLTDTKTEVLIRSYFQPDDHNNPTFLVLPDERIMVFYSRHTDEPCFYYRISRKPGDLSTLGKEMRLETEHNTTYPSPFILSDDPKHIYLCWRGIGWHPTIARLTLPDTDDLVKFDWGPHQMVRSTKGAQGVRPYAKYISNGKDKIYLAYTTTHPDNQPVNHIYFNYVDINTKELKDIKGNQLSVIGNGRLHEVDISPEYKTNFPYAVADDSPFRNWLWETAVDKEGKPVIAVVSISEDKKKHDYYHLRWSEDRWHKTFLSKAGGHFHQTPDIENCYSGGMAIDKNDPHVIYASVPVKGLYGEVYELKKFTISPDGGQVSEEQLTFNSEKNNLRPFVVGNAEKESSSLFWMYGDYYDWIVSSSRPQGYPTSIHTNVPVPSAVVALKEGLLKEAAFGRVSRKDKHALRVAKTNSFTISLSLALDSASYYGDIVKFAGLTYAVPQDERPKPFLREASKIYASTNILGNSDAWQKKDRGTGGQWYPPKKLETFHLTISYDGTVLRTYVDGLMDQALDVENLSLTEMVFGGFDGTMDHIKVYDRELAQDEIKALIRG